MPGEDAAKNFINGSANLFDKSAFAEAQGVDYMNVDSIMAESLSEKFKYGIAESFYLHKSAEYLVGASEVPKFLDKLKIQPKDHVLVKFGHVDIHYPDVESLSYQTTRPDLVGDCIFVLKKDCLPLVQYLDTLEQFKTTYALTLIDAAHFLYSSVIDLNLRPDLQEEIKKEGLAADLTKQVLANIYINVQIHWRTSFKCVALKIASPYREEGIINEIDDIKPF